MAKQKIYGVLESASVLLEPVSETRYELSESLDSELVGCWITVAGTVEATTISAPEVSSIDKNTGKTTRAGTIVATAPHLPPEANGKGGFLYQEKKGRYFLLSSGAADEAIQGDFQEYVGQDVKVTGEFGESNYILYNVRVALK